VGRDTVNGTGFASNAVINWNGNPRPTHFVSESQLTATIPTSDVAIAGTAAITALNPKPGGASVNPAYPEITKIASALTFAPLATNGSKHAPLAQSIAAGDFNGDGKLEQWSVRWGRGFRFVRQLRWHVYAC
jgi:hypothetical protein